MSTHLNCLINFTNFTTLVTSPPHPPPHFLWPVWDVRGTSSSSLVDRTAVQRSNLTSHTYNASVETRTAFFSGFGRGERWQPLCNLRLSGDAPVPASEHDCGSYPVLFGRWRLHSYNSGLTLAMACRTSVKEDASSVASHFVLFPDFGARRRRLYDGGVFRSSTLCPCQFPR